MILITLFCFLWIFSFFGTEDRSEQNISTFSKWVHKIGKVGPVKITSFAGMDYGLAATDNIKKGDVLMSIPFDYVICRKSIEKEVDAETLSMWKDLNDEFLLVSFLIREKALGNQSRYFEYIQALPSEVLSPVTYSHEELSMLEDESVIQLINNQQLEYHAFFHYFSSHICPAFSSLPIPLSRKLWACSYSTFSWALFIVNSRHIQVGNELWIIPFMDFRNYISTENPFQPTNHTLASSSYSLDHETNEIIIRSDRDYKKNRQIYMDYGPVPSYIYFITSGFIPVSNVNDCLLIPPPSLPDSHLLMQVIESLDLLSNGHVCLDVTRFLNTKPMSLFLLRELEEDALKECLAYHQQTVLQRSHSSWELYEIQQCALNEWQGDPKAQWKEIEPSLKQLLYDHIHNQYNHYSSSIGSDHLTIKSNKHLSKKSLTAIKWRISRKHLFDLVLSNLQIEHIDPEAEEKKKTEAKYKLDEPLLALNEWVKQNSELVKISVSSTPWGAHNLMAKSSVVKGEDVLSLHVNATIGWYTASTHPLLGSVFSQLQSQGVYKRVLVALMIIYEKYDNERYSPWFAYLRVCPSLTQLESILTMNSEDARFLAGSDAMTELMSLNTTLKHEYSLAVKLCSSHKLLKKVFLDSSILSFKSFLWSRLLFEKQNTFIEGEEAIIPPIGLSLNSVFQKVEEYTKVRLLNEYIHVLASESSGYTNDFMIKQGFPNYYMLLYKSDLSLAQINDCILWTLTIPVDHPDVDQMMNTFATKGLDLHSVFCIEPDVSKLPSDFIEMLSIIHGYRLVDDASLFTMVANAAKDKLNQYLTLSMSDRTRSRRGHFSSRLTQLNRFISNEKRILKDLYKNALRKLSSLQVMDNEEEEEGDEDEDVENVELVEV